MSEVRDQGVLLRAIKENLFHVSLQDSGGLLEIFGVPWLVEGSPQSLLSSLQDTLPFRVCV